MTRHKGYVAGAILAIVALSALYGFRGVGRRPIERPAETPTRSEPKSIVASTTELAAIQPDQSPETLVSVSGHVLELESKQPIDGAVLKLRRTGFHFRRTKQPGSQHAPRAGVIEPATTDASGAFTFDNVPAGNSYELVAQADGYLLQSRSVEVLDAPLQGVDLLLSRGCAISGLVLDADRAPVANAVVSFRSDKGNLPSNQSDPTPSDGAFAAKDLPPSVALHPEIFYRPPAGGKRDKHSDAELYLVPVGDLVFTLRPGEARTGVELILPNALNRSVSGIVVDEAGNPVKGVRVWAQGVGSGGYNPVGISDTQATTDSGTFAVRMLEPDTVDLKLTAEMFEPMTIPGVPVPASDLKVTMKSARFGQITGVVVDKETREPVNTAQVYLTSTVCEWGEVRGGSSSLRSDMEEGNGKVSWWGGKFRIDNVSPGRSRLYAYAPGYGSQQFDGIAVRTGETTNVELAMSPAGILRAKAEYAGKLSEIPFENGYLLCMPIDSDGTRYGISSWDDGTIRHKSENLTKFPHHGPLKWEMELGEGVYEVAVFVQLFLNDPDPAKVVGPYVFRRETVEIVAGKTTDLNVVFSGSGTIAGTVLWRDDDRKAVISLNRGGSAPIIEESPTFYRDGNDMARRDALIHELGYLQHFRTGHGTDSEGSFIFPGLEPGTYTVTVLTLLADGATVSLRGKSTVSVTDNETTVVSFGD